MTGYDDGEDGGVARHDGFEKDEGVDAGAESPIERQEHIIIRGPIDGDQVTIEKAALGNGPGAEQPQAVVEEVGSLQFRQIR
jgi:hypothetical protein